MLYSGVRSNNNLNIDVCYEIKRLNNIETNEIIYLNHDTVNTFISYIAYLSIGLLLLTLCNLIFIRLLIISYNLHHISPQYYVGMWNFRNVTYFRFPKN